MANAGVVGMAEVLSPNSSTGKTGKQMDVTTWSFVWAGAAALFLLFCHMALVGRAAR
jgi:hypothetical protein